MDYDAACKQATTNQGLDPVIAKLEAARIIHGLEQTGGFCMVVTVPIGERGTLAITDDGGLYASFFPGDTWREGPAEAGVEYETTLDALPALVSALAN